MSAIFTTWKNPLDSMIRAPGGKRIGDALRQAEANLELIREPCLADMDEQLDGLDRLSAEGGDGPDDEIKFEMYRRGNDIHAVAGVFGLTDLGAAAFCLCELIDRLRARGAWSKPAIDVHLSSLRLLRHPTDEDRVSVVEGLKRLTEKIAPLGSAT
jgi:hypothetical protein